MKKTSTHTKPPKNKVACLALLLGLVISISISIIPSSWIHSSAVLLVIFLIYIGGWLCSTVAGLYLLARPFALYFERPVGFVSTLVFTFAILSLFTYFSQTQSNSIFQALILSLITQLTCFLIPAVCVIFFLFLRKNDYSVLLLALTTQFAIWYLYLNEVRSGWGTTLNRILEANYSGPEALLFCLGPILIFMAISSFFYHLIVNINKEIKGY